MVFRKFPLFTVNKISQYGFQYHIRDKKQLFGDPLTEKDIDFRYNYIITHPRHCHSSATAFPAASARGISEISPNFFSPAVTSLR
jgi:hypothetical protein